MFLSKRNGIYYLWYESENGNRRKISTRCKEKKSAIEFLRWFRRPDAEKPASLLTTPLIMKPTYTWRRAGIVLLGIPAYFVWRLSLRGKSTIGP